MWRVKDEQLAILVEVAIEGEGVLETDPLAHSEGDRVGEREALVLVLLQKLYGPLLIHCRQGLDRRSGTRIYTGEESRCPFDA